MVLAQFHEFGAKVTGVMRGVRQIKRALLLRGKMELAGIIEGRGAIWSGGVRVGLR